MVSVMWEQMPGGKFKSRPAKLYRTLCHAYVSPGESCQTVGPSAYSEEDAEHLALERGWGKSETTGHFYCPDHWEE